MFLAPEVFLDTSFIVALENRDDPVHERAKQLDRELIDSQAIIVTHWGILLEIGDGYSRLGRRPKGNFLLAHLMTETAYEVVEITSEVLSAATRLYAERPDKEWGLTDCVSFVIMHQRGLTQALTADEHFAQAGFQALLRY